MDSNISINCCWLRVLKRRYKTQLFRDWFRIRDFSLFLRIGDYFYWLPACKSESILGNNICQTPPLCDPESWKFNVWDCIPPHSIKSLPFFLSLPTTTRIPETNGQQESQKCSLLKIFLIIGCQCSVQASWIFHRWQFQTLGVNRRKVLKLLLVTSGMFYTPSN